MLMDVRGGLFACGTPLLANTKPRKNRPQQVIAAEFAGDAVQMVLRQPKLFSKQVQRLRLLRRALLGQV